MDETLDILKALGDRNRLRIVLALADHAELCACQITELLGVRGATASRHLGQLTRAGLLTSRRDGRWIHYRLREDFAASAPLAWLDRATADDTARADDRARLAGILTIAPVELCRRQRGPDCCPADRPAAATR
jgi:DNA-binding transcriptional ArsR family regulator